MYCIKCGKLVGGSNKICEDCAQQSGDAGYPSEPTPIQSAPVPPPPPAVPPPPPVPPVQPVLTPPPPPVYVGGYVTSHKMVSNRALWKMILLGLITLGIYPVIAKDKMIHELNIAAFKHDGLITLSPVALTPLFALTFFIYYFVYNHQYVARLRTELRYRGIFYSVGPAHFWLLNVLFGFTIVCPLIYSHKVIKAHNLINDHYNRVGA